MQVHGGREHVIGNSGLKFAYEKRKQVADDFITLMLDAYQSPTGQGIALETEFPLTWSQTQGRLLWQRAAPAPQKIERIIRKNSYASSTPVTDGQRVIAFFGNSGFVCYDMNGELRGRTDIFFRPVTHYPYWRKTIKQICSASFLWSSA